MAKQKCPEFENHERWLVAFADMMTLLFALFVVLYSIANVDMMKLKKASQSIQKAFGVPSDDALGGAAGASKGNSRADGIFNRLKGNTSRNTMLTRNRREMSAIIAADMKTIESSIENRLYGSKNVPDTSSASERKDRVVFVTREADGIRVSLLARKFFQPNQTTLDPTARAALDGVADAIKGMGRIVRVEGHTDNLPFHKNGLTNWELAALRATSVTRYLVDTRGFHTGMIYAASFADSHPVASNDSPENRALNRRVDLKILYDAAPEQMHSDTPEEIEKAKADFNEEAEEKEAEKVEEKPAEPEKK